MQIVWHLLQLSANCPSAVMHLEKQIPRDYESCRRWHARPRRHCFSYFWNMGLKNIGALPSAFSAAIKLGCSQLCGLLQKVQALSTLLVVVQRRRDTILLA